MTTFKEDFQKINLGHKSDLEEHKKLIKEREDLENKLSSLQTSIATFDLKKKDLIEHYFSKTYDSLLKKNAAYLETLRDKELFSEKTILIDLETFEDYQLLALLKKRAPEAAEKLTIEYALAQERTTKRETITLSLEEKLTLPLLFEKENGSVSLYVPLKYPDMDQERLMKLINCHITEKAFSLNKEGMDHCYFDKSSYHKFGEYLRIYFLTEHSQELKKTLCEHVPEEFKKLNLSFQLLDLTELLQEEPKKEDSPSGPFYVVFNYKERSTKEHRYLITNYKENGHLLPDLGEDFTIIYGLENKELAAKMEKSRIKITKDFLTTYQPGRLIAEVLEPKKIFKIVATEPLTTPEQTIEKEELEIKVSEASLKKGYLSYGSREFYEGDSLLLKYKDKHSLKENPNFGSSTAFYAKEIFNALLMDGLQTGSFLKCIKTGEKTPEGHQIYEYHLT